MRRLLLLAALLLAGGVLLARNAERLLLFQLDPARVSPADAGEPRLRETVRDGAILWVAEPGPNRPTILYLPGNAGNLALRAGRFGRFLDRGYGLVALAYPGSSGSSGARSAAHIQALAAASYAALPGPVILYGESLGSGIAVQLAAQADKAPVAMVLEAPYTSILDLARGQYPQLSPLFDRITDIWPSRDRIGQRDVPLLILHGSDDRVVPAEMGRRLYDLSAATDKTLHIVKGAGHTDVWQPEAQRVLYRFLDRF